MQTFLLLLPSALSALVLAAHFLRRGEPLAVLPCLALVWLLFLRRPWSARVIQIALVLGAIEWFRTMAAMVSERIASGEPWTRMVVILGSVALVALLGAALLQTPAMQERFGLRRAAAPS